MTNKADLLQKNEELRKKSEEFIKTLSEHQTDEQISKLQALNTELTAFNVLLCEEIIERLQSGALSLNEEERTSFVEICKCNGISLPEAV